MTLRFDPAVQESQLRQSVAEAGYKDATIQHSSAGDFFVSLREITPEERVKLESDLQASLGSKLTVRDYAVTSASVVSQTVRYAVIAVLVAAVGIMIYISFAFRKMPRPFRWGACAVIALLHDILVVVGIFSILGWAIGIKIDALFITGMLTVAGYSVHDTIVVFDRIRENMTKGISNDFEKIANFSINETFVRTRSNGFS